MLIQEPFLIAAHLDVGHSGEACVGERYRLEEVGVEGVAQAARAPRRNAHGSCGTVDVVRLAEAVHLAYDTLACVVEHAGERLAGFSERDGVLLREALARREVEPTAGVARPRSCGDGSE